MVSKIVLPDNTVLSGRYQIERVIGQGGFGITYYARHLELGTHVAIKEFFLSGMCTREQNGMVGIQDISPEKFEQFRKRFREEAHTLCQLSNSHVVAVRDIFDENGTTYIVMDYVAGETLQKKVEREGALQYDVAVNYMAQLCEAVEHIHAHHILHRDIKPENIIITPQNNVVLIDFGSARSFVHDKEQKHTAMLTMGYAPIEQYTATSKKGNYTDLYAVGGTFYFILTGRKPIPAADRMLNDELQPPRTFNLAVPESASRTIMKALNLKPEDRYQAVADFKRDLLEGGTTQAPQIPTGGSTYTTPPKTDNTVPIVVLSVIGALILCLALGYGISRRMGEGSRGGNAACGVQEGSSYASEAPAADMQHGYIKDEDGWTNVRAGRSSKSEILKKIKDGSEIRYIPDASGWYEVYDTDGIRLGYVHHSLILPAPAYEDAATGASSQNHSADYFNPDRSDVEEVLTQFTECDNNDDFYCLKQIYAPYLERYYSIYGISCDEVMEKHRNYNAKFGVYSKVGTYRWGTLEIRPISSEKVEVVCIQDYEIEREDPTKPTNFVLEKHFIFNTDFQIVSIYDNQLEKW